MSLFTTLLDIDVEIAHVLVAHGFSSLEEIAYVPKEELLAIEAFDEEIIDELRHRANDALLTQALTVEEGLESVSSQCDLAAMDGMTKTLLGKLKNIGITTMDALAEHCVDELLPISGMTEEKAGALIMQARASWFLDASSNE